MTLTFGYRDKQLIGFVVSVVDLCSEDGNTNQLTEMFYINYFEAKGLFVNGFLFLTSTILNTFSLESKAINFILQLHPYKLYQSISQQFP